MPWPTARNYAAALLAPWLDMDPDAGLAEIRCRSCWPWLRIRRRSVCSPTTGLLEIRYEGTSHPLALRSGHDARPACRTWFAKYGEITGLPLVGAPWVVPVVLIALGIMVLVLALQVHKYTTKDPLKRAQPAARSAESIQHAGVMKWDWREPH